MNETKNKEDVEKNEQVQSSKATQELKKWNPPNYAGGCLIFAFLTIFAAARLGSAVITHAPAAFTSAFNQVEREVVSIKNGFHVSNGNKNVDPTRNAQEGLESGVSAAAQADEIDIPDLSNKTYAVAKSELANVGFSNIKVEETHGKDKDWVMDDDLVVGQDPAAGTHEKKDSEITIKVSSRAAEFEAVLAGGVGQDVTSIWTKFGEFGYAPTFIQDNSNQDITKIVSEDASQPGRDGAVSWVLTGLKSIDIHAKTVQLGVQSRDVLDIQQRNKEMQDHLESVLPLSSAWTYMDQAFQQSYPYGFQLHSIMGVISQTVVDENTWRLSAYCDVTNAFGVVMKNRVATADVLVVDGGVRVTNMSVN